MIDIETIAQMGINASRQHQRLIARLTTALMNRFNNKTITLEPLPKTMLDESETSPVPDILLADNERDTSPVIIEIAHGTGVKKDLKKVRRLIEEDDYGIEEGFVYDYKQGKWYKTKKGVGDIIDNASFCEALNLDLAMLM